MTAMYTRIFSTKVYFFAVQYTYIIQMFNCAKVIEISHCKYLVYDSFKVWVKN